MALGEIIFVVGCMLVITRHGLMNVLLKNENGGAMSLPAIQCPVGGCDSIQQQPSVTTNTVQPLLSHVGCISRRITIIYYLHGVCLINCT